MLILGRREDQKVVIICPTGEVIKVGFQWRKDSRSIAMNFDAPHHIQILREELHKEIEDE